MMAFIYIGSILKHLVHGIDTELSTSGCTQPLCIEFIAYRLYGLVSSVLSEHLLHERCCVIIYDIFLSFLIHVIVEHLVPVVQRMLSAIVHPSLNSLKKADG